MDYLQLIENMTEEVYRNLLRAVELGRWPDGRAVTPEQRENAMQAIIAWGERHLPEEQRVGYIKPKDAAAAQGDSDEQSILKWRE